MDWVGKFWVGVALVNRVDSKPVVTDEGVIINIVVPKPVDWDEYLLNIRWFLNSWIRMKEFLKIVVDS
jgi:hypothetical protein